jgi:hypothetical protein
MINEKTKLTFISLIYIITIILLLFFFGGEKLSDKTVKNKKNHRRESIIKEKQGRTERWGEFLFKKPVSKNSDNDSLEKVKKEAIAIYGKSFTQKTFNLNSNLYERYARNDELSRIRKELAGKYNIYIQENSDEQDKIFNSEEFTSIIKNNKKFEDKETKDAVPLPDAKNKYQMMSIALINYLSFSNDIKGFFNLKTNLLQRLTSCEDKLYLTEKSAEIVLQHYMRENVMNKTAIIDVGINYEKMIIDCGKDLIEYKLTLCGYYYWGGNVQKALQYLNDYYSENENVNSKLFHYYINFTFCYYNFAAGNFNKSYSYLVKSISYFENNFSPLKIREQRSILFSNITTIGTYMKKTPPEKILFQGILMAGYQDNLAKKFLLKYLATAKNIKFKKIAKKKLKSLGEDK